MRKRSRRLLLLSLALLAAALAALKLPGGDALEATASAGGSLDARAAAPEARGMLARLPQRPALDASRSELFTAHSWAPAAPAPAPAPGQPSAPPAAPPNPYRFAGTVRHGGGLMIILARGDSVVEAKEGEELDGGYRVRSASSEGVALVYTPLGIEQQVTPAWVPDPAGVTAPTPAPAPSPLPPGSPLASPR